MKWLRFCSAIVATLGLTTAAHADILDLLNGHGNHGAGKCCDSAPSCQPQSCKPTITRPCERKVHTYQRQICDKKPPCCKPAPECCAPKCSAPAPECSAPKAECCAPKAECGKSDCCGLCEEEPVCCDVDPCVIAELIYKSQTACYADDREDAIDQLGDYDCQCAPEIMSAMIYALNDASEEVRAEAADEIGDIIRRNPCCCSKEVVEALKCALADCDSDVRRQAEEALEACGYCVVDGCCESACGGCADGGTAPAPMDEPAPAPPMEEEAAPAPTPEPQADQRAPLRLRQTSQPRQNVGAGLADLFRLFD